MKRVQHDVEAILDRIDNADEHVKALRDAVSGEGKSQEFFANRDGGAINVEGPFTPRIVDKMSHEQAFEAKYLCKSG